MCRHLAWLGPPVRLGALLLDPPHSLLRQSFAPTDMRCDAVLNADGFGAGWYPGGDGAVGDGAGGGDPTGDDPGARVPVRYRRAVPMWTDTAFAGLAAEVSSGAVLAAVRSATVGTPVVETACAPFAAGRWLFSHNGIITGWPASVAPLAARLAVTDLLTLDAPIDSALLWAMVRHRLLAGAPLGSALADVVGEVLAVAPGSRLNLLLTDGIAVAATTVHHSLWIRAVNSSVLVCSEPVDDATGWQPVPDHQLLTATRAGFEVTPLTAPPAVPTGNSSGNPAVTPSVDLPVDPRLDPHVDPPAPNAARFAAVAPAKNPAEES